MFVRHIKQSHLDVFNERRRVPLAVISVAPDSFYLSTTVRLRCPNVLCRSKIAKEIFAGTLFASERIIVSEDSCFVAA